MADGFPKLTFSDPRLENEYLGRLYKEIINLFVSSMPAVQLKDSPPISRILHEEEMQVVQKKFDTEGNHSAARKLLEFMRMKPNWFDAFMKALSLDYLKLQEHKVKFLQVKGVVDEEWLKEHPACYQRGPPVPVVNPSVQSNFKTPTQTTQDSAHDNGACRSDCSSPHAASAASGIVNDFQLPTPASTGFHKDAALESPGVDLDKDIDTTEMLAQAARPKSAGEVIRKEGPPTAVKPQLLQQSKSQSAATDTVAGLVSKFQSAATMTESVLKSQSTTTTTEIAMVSKLQPATAIPKVVSEKQKSSDDKIQTTQPEDASWGEEYTDASSQPVSDEGDDGNYEKPQMPGEDENEYSQLTNLCLEKDTCPIPAQVSEVPEQEVGEEAQPQVLTPQQVQQRRRQRPQTREEHPSLREAISDDPNKDFEFSFVRDELCSLRGWSTFDEEYKVIHLVKPHRSADGYYVLWYWKLAKRPTICVTHGGKVITFVVHKSSAPPTRFYINKRQKRSNSLRELLQYHKDNGIEYYPRQEQQVLVLLNCPCS